MSARLSPWLLAVLLLGVAGCSALFDEERAQCDTDDDCAESRSGTASLACVGGLCVPAFTERWRCVDDTFVAPPVRLRGSVRLAEDGRPLAGLRVRACRELDLECTTTADEASTDEDGGFALALPALFAGALVYEAEGLVPLLDFTTDWSTQERVLQGDYVVSLYDRAGLEEVIAPLSSSLEPERAQLRVTVYDCFGEAAPEVVLSYEGLGPEALEGYLREGSASAEAIGTDDSGEALVVNALPRFTGIVASDRSGRVLMRRSVALRAGWITTVSLYPPVGLTSER